MRRREERKENKATAIVTSVSLTKIFFLLKPSDVFDRTELKVTKSFKTSLVFVPADVKEKKCRRKFVRLELKRTLSFQIICLILHEP